jgi:hypothetical protein
MWRNLDAPVLVLRGFDMIVDGVRKEWGRAGGRG